MVSKMQKKFSKNKALLKGAYKKLIQFMMEEYEEIENFADKAYGENVYPSKSEINAVLIDKQIK